VSNAIEPPGGLGDAGPPDELSLVLIQLFKGPLYRDSHDKLWEPLIRQRSRVVDHVGVLGLRLEIDESDGYGFLRSLRDGESEIDYPRLVTRHALSFSTSLLVALLRKRLIEFEKDSAEVRLVLSRDELLDLIRVYSPSDFDDVKLLRQLDLNVKRLVELGFLRKMRGSTGQYEVRRIIRAFVDGQWLGQFERRLREYIDEACGAPEGTNAAT
jgi:hypothetical protein